MLGMTISRLRKQSGITQEQLAQKLDVTNQAVSKWETDQCCPDVAMLPKLADVFGVSIDLLFGREQKNTQKELPWEDDNALYVVVYAGHTLIGAEGKENQKCTFHYEGPVRDIHCNCNLECGDVAGDVAAGGYVECGDVGGTVKAMSYVECSDVGGDLQSYSYVECGDVGGNVTAMSYVECGDIGGSVTKNG